MTDEGLVLAAADLARHNPEGWNKFLTEMDNHIKRLDYVLRQAGYEGIHAAQGMAREAAFLRDTFYGAVVDAEKIRNGVRNR